MQRERIVAAACGSQRIVVASYRKEPGGTWWLEAAQVREVPAGSDWLGELVLAMSDARWELRRHVRLVVSPPPESVWLKSVRLPRLDTGARAAVLRFELEQATPFPPDSVLGAAILASRTELEHEHLLSVLKRDLANRVATALESVRCIPRIVPLAARLPGIVAAPPGGGSAVLAVIDPVVTLLALAHHHGVAIRTVAHARMPSDPPERVAAQVAGDVVRAIHQLREQAGAAAVLELRVAGNANRIELLLAEVRARVEIPVLPFASAEVLSAASVPAAELAGTLALVRGESELVEPIDLTPPSLRRQRELRPRRRLWVASAALLLFAFGLLAARLQTEFADAQRRVAKLQRELAPLRVLAAERSAHVARIDRAQQLLSDVTQLERLRAQPAKLLAGVEAEFVAAGTARIERLEWREGAELHPVALPPRPGNRPLPPQLRVAGVVPSSREDRGVALTRARQLVQRLAPGALASRAEFQRFDDAHRDGVGFECELVLNWEGVP